jgi:hypothetical protein
MDIALWPRVSPKCHTKSGQIEAVNERIVLSRQPLDSIAGNMGDSDFMARPASHIVS